MIDLSPHRTAILVLGMHRSGTSAVTRFLNLLGADLPSKLLAAAPNNNELGFWESLDFQAFNDELLTKHLSRWDDWSQLDVEFSANEQESLRSLLLSHFESSQVFVLKDPRICRLLPAWTTSLRSMECRVTSVLPLRHPREVAQSLFQRDGFPKEKSTLLWLRHELDAEYHSRGMNRIVVPYQDLLTDWKFWAEKIGDRLDIPWPAINSENQELIAEFLDPAQRHHDVDAAESACENQVDAWAQQAYDLLLQLSGEYEAPEVIQKLDALRQEMNQSCAAFEQALRNEIENAQRAQEQATYKINALEESLENRIQRLNHVELTAQERKRALEERTLKLETVERLASERKQQLQERSGRVTQLEEQLTERKYALQERAERVAQLEQISEQRKIAVEERAARVAELEQISEQRKIAVIERATRVTQLERINADRKAQLESRIRRVHELEQLSAARKSEIAQAHVLRDELTAEVAQLQENIGKQLKQHIQHNIDYQKLFRRSRLDNLLHRQQQAQARANKQKLGLPPRILFGQAVSLRQRKRLWNQARRLLALQLFDTRWYYLAYPDVLNSTLHPIWHWLSCGCDEGRQPNVFFDPQWYLRQCPDVKTAGLNPLMHYLEHGASEGRHPGPLFNALWYLQKHSDVAAAGTDPLQHYLRYGRTEGRQAIKLFRNDKYLTNHNDVKDSGLDAFEHYMLAGGREKRDPCDEFSSAWYLENYPDVRKAGLNPLFHYLAFGHLEGRIKHPSEADSAATISAPSRSIGLSQAAPIFTGNISPKSGQNNILLCAHAAHGQLFGGERSFIDVLALLEPLPYNVFVVVPALNPDYIEQIRPYCCEITPIAYPYWRKGSRVDTQAVHQLKGYMVSRQIDLVHVNTIVVREPLLAAQALGIARAIHVRESVHDDSWLSDMIGLAPDELVKQVIASTECIVANSAHSLEEFHKPNCSFVVPNTFDMDVLDIPNEIKGGILRIGMISSNIPKKGLEDFVNLAQACAQDHPTLEFQLIGPNNEHIQRLKKRQSEGKIGSNLIFAPYQATPNEALALCNIVVNFSHFKESFGRTIAEAQAARRPVIVYNFGAPQDLVQDGQSGHVIDFKQWHLAIPKLIEWLERPELLQQMGECGHRYIRKHFARSVGVQALQDAYSHCLSQPIKREPRIIPATNKHQLSPAPLKLAYFCWHFPVPSETFVLNELRLLVADGIDVEVFCKQSPYPDFQPDFPIQWTRIQSVEDLAEKLRDSKRNFVHAHFTYPTVTEMVWPACEQAGLPFTFIAHAQDIFRHENDQRNRVGEIVQSDSCRGVFTLGRFHRDFLLERGVPAEKLIINPNGIDPSLFPFRARPRDEKADRRKSICAIHRLTEKKGLKYLIEAARELEDAGYEINIYGYGDQEPVLQEMLEQQPLDFVKICGPLKTRDAILDVLHQHDLFACPSVRTDNGDMDGIPTVLIEAMAAGTPVITTHLASISDLVQDEVTGMIVESANATALAQGIQRFFQLPAAHVEGIIHNARQAVEQRHDARYLTKRLQRIWQQTTVDIVIVSWNNLPELEVVISHLYAYTRSPFHLIVCDNGSEADVTSYLFTMQSQRDNLSVVHKGENSFVGPGTNTAIQVGQSDHIIYVCGKEGFALRDGWETDMLDWMEKHPKVGLAGSLGYSPSYLHGQNLAKGIPLFDQFRNQHFADEHPQRKFLHVQGGLFILRRGMYQEIGGFSESVPHAYTDVEYSFYVESCGWELGSIPSILALFNKTRPDLWSRIHEGIKAIHPPQLADLPLLHKIAEEKVHFCNCCGWHGVAFETEAICPQCSSSPSHRSLYRYLAESTLCYRRLPALWLNPHSCLSPFWKDNFQGRQLTQQQLLNEISKKGSIDHAAGGQHLIALSDIDVNCENFDTLLSELHRILHSDGLLLLLPSTRHNSSLIIQKLENNGFRSSDQTRYSSHVLRYALEPLYAFDKPLQNTISS
ncbi:MAG: glycosyltransferase [Oceanococcus sp.]